MNRSLTYLFIAFMSVFVIACQKEPDESILDEPVANCKLMTAESLDTIGSFDLMEYVYTGEKITRLNHSDYYTTLTYDGNKITQRNFFETNSTALGYDKMYYNSDGTLNKCENYFSDPGIPAPFLYFISEFTYAGGKLVKMIEKEDISSGMPLPPVPVYEYTYTYTGNNITRCVIKDLLNGGSDTITYQFDNTANHFSKRSTNLFVDPLFADFIGELLPLGLSANNVIKLQQQGFDSNITYTLDAKKNMTELLVDGIVYFRYTYQCQ